MSAEQHIVSQFFILNVDFNICSTIAFNWNNTAFKDISFTLAVTFSAFKHAMKISMNPSKTGFTHRKMCITNDLILNRDEPRDFVKIDFAEVETLNFAHYVAWQMFG